LVNEPYISPVECILYMLLLMASG